MPYAGELKERVRFERRAVAETALGGTSGDWAPLIYSRAVKLAPHTTGGGQGEQVIAQRLQGVQVWDLWVRCDSETNGVTTDDRAVDARDSSRVFNIRAITNPDMRRRWWVMTCEQGVADG